MDKYWVVFISILTDSLNMSLFTVIKAFNKDYSLLSKFYHYLGYQLTFLLAESMIAYFFCYRLGAGLSGLWYGWILGTSFNSIFSWVMLVKNQKKKPNLKINFKKNNKYEALLANKK